MIRFSINYERKETTSYELQQPLFSLPLNIMYAFIQARMGSSRLPGKMTMQLPDGKTLLEAVISRLSAHNVTPVLLTTEQPADNALVELAEEFGIATFRGDETHVLKRFIQAGAAFHVSPSDFVLRICADNPFLSHYIINQTLEACSRCPELDYFSFGHGSKPGIKHHTGIFVEAVKMSALHSLLPLNNDWYNEHVTIGLYENPDKYAIQITEIPTEWHPDFDKIRLTIDDIDDWNFCLTTYPLLTPLDFPEQRKLLLSQKSWVTLMENQITKYQK
jgi:spore coat polysaccharide biosynthesis protein SpsF